MHNLQLF